MHSHLVRGAAPAALTLVVALGLAGCGDDTTASPSGSISTAADGTTFNDADVRFATDMVQHHAQALQMVVMTQERQLDPAVRTIADDIRTAQVQEVETMVGWLLDWDQEVPETSLDHANAGHDMGDMSGTMEMDMPGAMSAAQMGDLEDAPDAEFQDLWLEMMVEHHTGAIEMAETEQDDGENDDAIALAGTIVETQQTEIEAMQQLVG